MKLDQICIPEMKLVKFTKKGLIPPIAKNSFGKQMVNLKTPKTSIQNTDRKCLLVNLSHSPYISKRLKLSLQHSKKGKQIKFPADACRQNIDSYHKIKKTMKTLVAEIYKSQQNLLKIQAPYFNDMAIYREIQQQRIKKEFSNSFNDKFHSKYFGIKSSNDTYSNTKPLNRRLILRQRLKTIDELNQKHQKVLAYKRYAQLSIKQRIQNDPDEDLGRFKKLIHMPDRVKTQFL